MPDEGCLVDLLARERRREGLDEVEHVAAQVAAAAQRDARGVGGEEVARIERGRRGTYKSGASRLAIEAGVPVAVKVSSLSDVRSPSATVNGLTEGQSTPEVNDFQASLALSGSAPITLI